MVMSGDVIEGGVGHATLEFYRSLENKKIALNDPIHFYSSNKLGPVFTRAQYSFPDDS